MEWILNEFLEMPKCIKYLMTISLRCVFVIIRTFTGN